MTIAILCPTKGRNHKLQRMIDSAISTKSDGPTLDFYIAYSSNKDLPQNTLGKNVWVSEYADLLPTAQKWNWLADQAYLNQETKLLMLGADDMIFSTPLWDKALLDHYNALENKIHVYALRDSRDENGTPHPIVTREYIEAMGWFLPPYFLHWYVDSWTVGIAKLNNCFTHLKDYLLIHDKPSDKGQADATHTGIRAMGWHERDKWVNDKLLLTAYGMDCQRLRQALAQ